MDAIFCLCCCCFRGFLKKSEDDTAYVWFLCLLHDVGMRCDWL